MAFLKYHPGFFLFVVFLLVFFGFSALDDGLDSGLPTRVYARAVDDIRPSDPSVFDTVPLNTEKNDHWFENIPSGYLLALFMACLVPLIIIRWKGLLAYEISKHKATEQALCQSEELFKRTFIQAPLGAAIVDGLGKFINVNTKLTEILGYDASELVQRNIFEMTHPDDEAMIREHYRIMKGGGVEYCYFMTRCIHKTGRILWTRISVRPIFDNTGQPAFFLPMIEDITELKQHEDALLKLSRAVEQSPVSVVMTDPEGTIEYVNPKFTDVTGYSQDEALGKNPRIVSSGQQDKAFYKNLWDTILGGDIWQGEFINKKKNGEIYWEYASISPVTNHEGHLTHFVAVKEDITQRKKTDEALKKQLDELNRTKQNMMTVMEDLETAKVRAEEATRTKGEFLANMSHEIRTPMNAIIGMSHLALQTELTSQQKDYLSKIQSSSHALLTIINDILDFSKIEAGKLHMEKTGFDLEAVLNQVADMIHMRVGEKHLELLMDIKQDVPTFLVGDALRLSQILSNLADNAVKFTGDGEILIGVEKQQEIGNDLILKFWVKDTGIGMTPEQIKKLFRPFIQADTSTTRTYGGTGLGLSICTHLVQMMDGVIGVDSTLNHGSTFYFTARFGLQDSQKADTHYVLDDDLKGKRALVVDDNALARRIMHEQLELFGFEVVLAESGMDALERLEKNNSNQGIDLIFMDYKMPGMDGLECVKKIRDMDHVTANPKIIMVTAYGDEGIQAREEVGALDGFLVKPLSPSTLFDALMKAYGRKAIEKLSGRTESVSDSGILDVIAGARILVVEDNEINTQVAVELLESARINVTVALNGKEAIAALEKNEFDAVLMDVQMPVMDGLEATRTIRARGKSSTDLPIIAMTAHAMAGDKEKSFDSGMNDHITKPVNPDELFNVLATWIGKNRDEGPATDKRVTTIREKPLWMGTERPGISFDKGLRHTGGHVDLYRKIINTFIRDYSGASAMMEIFLARNDFDGAWKLAHTIKGVAGNIGAEDLYEASSDLEKVVHSQHTSELNDSVTRFYAQLSLALDSLNKVTAETGSSEPLYNKHFSLGGHPVLPLLKELKHMVRDRSPKACRDMVKTIESLSHDSPYAGDIAMSP